MMAFGCTRSYVGVILVHVARNRKMFNLMFMEPVRKLSSSFPPCTGTSAGRRSSVAATWGINGRTRAREFLYLQSQCASYWTRHTLCLPGPYRHLPASWASTSTCRGLTEAVCQVFFFSVWQVLIYQRESCLQTRAFFKPYYIVNTIISAIMVKYTKHENDNFSHF